MPYSGRFDCARAGSEWTGGNWPALALICHHARLTNQEAQIVCLWTRGLSYASIGEILQIRQHKVVVWRSVHHAVGKIGRLLGRYQPELLDRRRHNAHALLQCFRNTAHSGGALLVGWNRIMERWEPASLRGEVVTIDDLINDPATLIELVAEALMEGRLGEILRREPEMLTRVQGTW